MKTWSKRRSIPLGLAEQPDREREQGGESDWKEDEARNEPKGRGGDEEKGGYTSLCIVMLQLKSLQSIFLMAKENAFIWRSGHQERKVPYKMS